MCREKGGLYPNLEYCTAGHHAGLPDYGSVQDQASEPTLCGRRKKKIKDYHAYQNEIEIPPLTSLPFDPMKTKNPHFAMSVFIRMLYSCLVDADFLDTERFMQEGKAERDSGETIEILLEKLEDYISSWLQNTELDTINGRRTEILKACLESGRREQGVISSYGSYRRRKNSCFFGICASPCSGTPYGQSDLCDPLYQYHRTERTGISRYFGRTEYIGESL